MIAYKKNCKVCNLIKSDKKLMKRIYDCGYYIPHSKDSLAAIHRDCNQVTPGAFSYLALTNHCKKHQHINAADYEKAALARKVKGIESQLIEARYEAVNVQDAVMNEGMKKLESGEMRITADHLLRAAKDKQDAEAKRKDQQLALAEMVAFFASGEDNQGSDKIYDRRIIDLDDYDPAIPIS
jgi:hypothetical protein